MTNTVHPQRFRGNDRAALILERLANIHLLTIGQLAGNQGIIYCFPWSGQNIFIAAGQDTTVVQIDDPVTDIVEPRPVMAGNNKSCPPFFRN